MLLAIDIGNTNIKFGLHDGADWVALWRAQTVPDRTADEYGVYLQGFMQQYDCALQDIDRAVLSSVVPQLTDRMARMVTRLIGNPPLIVYPPQTTLGIALAIDHPESIGSDLVAAAVAAYERFQGNCIAVGLGTATTFVAIEAPGVLRGVVIAAGLNVMIDGLVSRTAQLPYIPLEAPPSILGTNTVHAMQAGLLIGFAALLEGVIDRMRDELGGAQVIATGGLAEQIAPLTGCFDAVDPWLTLDGLRLIATRN